MPTHSSSTNWLKRTGRALVLFATLNLCSCTTSGLPRSGETQVPQRVDLIPATPSQIVPPVADQRQGGIQQIQYQVPATFDPNCRPQFTPSVPRGQVAPLVAGHDACLEECCVRGPEAFPDEYIFDGGDRGLPFHYEDFQRAGLETEDTLAEFDDHTGESHVRPSTRVAIYAPRFGSVSSFSLPHEGASSQMIVSADKTVQTYDMRNRAGTIYHNDYLAPGGLGMRSRASGIEAESETQGLNQTTVAGRNDKLLNVFQNVAFLRHGQLNQSDVALVAEYVDAALTWTQVEMLKITATTTAGNELESIASQAELVGLEDGRKTKGDLRIVKLADKKVALPGQVVTFNLRYDNLGDFELKNIRIIDNLTGRLEFIEGSAESDRPGTFEVFDNGAGSLVLEFKLSDDLPGHAGGVITFQARVR